jgi:chromosome segregation ATPase
VSSCRATNAKALATIAGENDRLRAGLAEAEARSSALGREASRDKALAAVAGDETDRARAKTSAWRDRTEEIEQERDAAKARAEKAEALLRTERATCGDLARQAVTWKANTEKAELRVAEVSRDLQDVLDLMPVDDASAGIAFAGHHGEYVRAVVDAIASARNAWAARADDAERALAAEARDVGAKAERERILSILRRLDLHHTCGHPDPDLRGGGKCDACRLDELAHDLER